MTSDRRCLTAAEILSSQKFERREGLGGVRACSSAIITTRRGSPPAGDHRARFRFGRRRRGIAVLTKASARRRPNRRTMAHQPDSEHEIPTRRMLRSVFAVCTRGCYLSCLRSRWMRVISRAYGSLRRRRYSAEYPPAPAHHLCVSANGTRLSEACHSSQARRQNPPSLSGFRCKPPCCNAPLR